MQEKRWNLKSQPPKSAVDHLKNAINASDALAVLFAQRGLTDFNKVKAFLNPQVRDLHSPFMMKDMEVAVHRITDAISRGEQILVYGDYDVDGTSAVALLYGFLEEHYEQVSFYIPDRYKEGYGVSFDGIDFAEDNGVTLMVALDCGVKAVEKVAYAKEKGIDFIICDHHLPGQELPNAVAILNPLQADCDYPYKSLCGCGIGFKLIQALCETWDIDRSIPFKQVDLVAIATGADIVPMTGENRILVHLGMRAMERALRPGIAEILEHSGLSNNGAFAKKEMTVSDLVFKIGPRINAAGRMKHGGLAVELLTARTTEQAKAKASEVDQHNSDRREVDGQLLEEALQMIDQDKEFMTGKSTMLYAEHWHKGVIGIAASRLQDQYYRPTIVLTKSNDKLAGSARSVKGFDIHAAIEECADLLENFGGHPAAAGMTLLPEQLDAFKLRFEEVVSERITDELLIPCLDIDLELSFHQITDKFLIQMNRLAPFGPENMRPVFSTHKVRATANTRRVGEDRSHLKLEVTQDGVPGKKIGGIAFGMGEILEQIEQAEYFSIAYTLEWNEFRGKRSVQMLVRDIKFD